MTLPLRSLLVAGLLIAKGFSQFSLAMDEVSVTVAVSDEYGKPVSNATVSMAFYQPKSLNVWDGLNSKNISGTTGTNGMFTATEKTVDRIGFAVDRQEYYRSEDVCRLQIDRRGKTSPLVFTTNVVIRRKGNPIPMYAKNFAGMKQLPVAGAPIGYDLLAGAWTAPYGNGNVADIVFGLERNYTSSSDYAATLSIAVTRDQDGFAPIADRDTVAQSLFRFPRQAPENGYSETNIVLTVSDHSGQGERRSCSTPSQNLFFRVRTEVDENGRIKKALYGKLIGPIECGLHDTKTGKLRLTYYVNPDPNNRNLEFDPEKNLFKNLEWFEQVKEP